ncbi:hypothetical protein ACFQ21_09395 [Ohtaekwangia kribbensis]|uniref:Uncharacterized protein n=1 Tax=Ohtaekwangia kribbensis TaxID=688913 RepID=A0ABW3K259_9BACT
MAFVFWVIYSSRCYHATSTERLTTLIKKGGTEKSPSLLVIIKNTGYSIQMYTIYRIDD